MEQYNQMMDKVEKKIDSLERSVEASNELARTTNALMLEVVSEMRRANDTNALHLQYIQRDNADLKETTKGLTDRLKTIELEMVRFNQMEANITNLKDKTSGHEIHPIKMPKQGRDDFNYLANQWLHSKVAERFFWVLGILVTTLIAKWAGIVNFSGHHQLPVQRIEIRQPYQIPGLDLVERDQQRRTTGNE